MKELLAKYKRLIASKYKLLKERAFVIIYGRDTVAGKLFDLILLGFILISAFLSIFESIKTIDHHIHTLLVVLEWMITIFFSIEYALRIVCTPNWRRYIFSFYGIIDLISILPFYLSFFAVESKVLSIIRILRLLRIFRILDLVQFTQQANQLKKALKNSQTKILVFIYFVLVLSVILGALMYMIEPHDKAFTSIPRSIYWCIVTLTTVGYGDVVPTTTFGQIMASIIMILGYGIIAVPTGIVTSEYSRTYRKKEPHKSDISHKMPQDIGYPHSHTHSHCKYCNTYPLPDGALYCPKCGAKQ
ncbi:ion transporter [Capnocytophaga granulosa]|uniref:ion transporter n=1 Tax=Capnocytophaga granulosa TaxID=45242 RepID=UPI0023F11319|nr:ion transporter [Capnocytophaga granulosa]